VRRAPASFSILAALAASWFAATPGHAGVYKCNSHTMIATDYAAMKRAATKAAAPHVLDWSDVSPCMNPGRGRVWIRAVPEPQPDGTRMDYAAICERARGPWKCEVPGQRRYEFSVAISGREQKFVLDLPRDLDARVARDFAALAFARGATLTIREGCQRPANEPRTAQDEKYEQYMHNTFSPGESPFEGSIEVADGSMTLSNDSFALEFRRASPTGAWIFDCWWDVVVVA
jgi:hypothetical protein